jgi:hypothetical protein
MAIPLAMSIEMRFISSDRVLVLPLSNDGSRDVRDDVSTAHTKWA